MVSRYERTCVFGYNVTWNRDNGNLVASNCLQSEPSWMMDHKTELESKVLSYNFLLKSNYKGYVKKILFQAIGDLILTGSHDAGAYREFEGQGDDNWGTNSVFAQEEDLLHQLLWGVRFLDIRAGFYPTTPERFWLVHGIIKAHPMMEGIEDVKTFLRNTQVILIIYKLFVWEDSDSNICRRL